MLSGFLFWVWISHDGPIKVSSGLGFKGSTTANNEGMGLFIFSNFYLKYNIHTEKCSSPKCIAR